MKKVVPCLFVTLFILVMLFGCGDPSLQGSISQLPSVEETTGENNTTTQQPPCYQHTYTESVISPTCTEDGYTLHTCSNCQDQYIDSVVKSQGHRYEQHIMDAACNDLQKNIFVCAACKYSYAEPLNTPGTLHSYIAVITPPDHENGGYTTHTCKHCKISYVDNYTDPARYSLGLSYQNISGRYYVSGIGSCSDTHIIIPAISEYGQKVTGILAEAFANTNVVSITVSPGVTEIRANAFYNCTNLITVSLPADANLGENLFFNTPKLSSLTMALTKPLAKYFFNYRQSASPEEYQAVCQGDGSFTETYYGSIPLSLKEVTIIGNVCKYALANCQAITTIHFEGFVETIGNNAFCNCISLTQVTIPETVNYIGSYAFSKTGIVSIILPDGLSFTAKHQYIFSGCTQLRSVVLPKNITMLPPSMFLECSRLESIQIPKSVTFLCGSSLAKTGLKSITIPDSVTAIDTQVFSGCSNLVSVKLPAQLISVDYGAFEDCIALKELIFPATTQTIGYNAMAGCTRLQKVTLPPNLQNIEERLFKNCSSLKHIVLPAAITHIEREAFLGCSALTQVTFPDSVTHIGYAAFENSGLLSVTIPTAVQTIGDRVFANCTKLRSVVFKNDATTLVNDMFLGCTVLESISLPANITHIPTRFCKNAKSLKSITLPIELVAIGEEAFYGCSSLEKVVFPETLRKLDYRAFMGCTALRSIDFSNAALSWNGEWEYATFADCVSLKYVKNYGQLTEFNDSIFKNTPVQTVKDGLTITLGWLIKADPSAVPKILNVPSGVTKIKSYVFSGCTHITEVTLPEGVVYLGTRIFGTSELSSLIKLVLPDSLQSFSVDTLYFFSSFKELVIGKGMQSLTGTPLYKTKLTIRFRGTAAEFEQMPWRHNECIQNSTIICTDTTIPPP